MHKPKMHKLQRWLCTTLALLMAIQLAAPAFAATVVDIGTDDGYVDDVSGTGGTGDVSPGVIDPTGDPPEPGVPAAPAEGTLEYSLSWRVDAETKTLYIENDTGKLCMTEDFDAAGEQPWAAWNGYVTDVEVADGIQILGMYFFAGMTALERVKLGADVEMFDVACFEGCIELNGFVGITGEEAWEMGRGGTVASAFNGTKFATEYDQGSGEDQPDLGELKPYEQMVNGERILWGGYCGLDTQWTLNRTKGLLHIYGNGSTDDFDVFGPWAEYAYEIKHVTVSETVTRVGDFAFYGAPVLKDVEIWNNTAEIGDYAFNTGEVISVKADGLWQNGVVSNTAFYGEPVVLGFEVLDEDVPNTFSVRSVCSERGYHGSAGWSRDRVGTTGCDIIGCEKRTKTIRFRTGKASATFTLDAGPGFPYVYDVEPQYLPGYTYGVVTIKGNQTFEGTDADGKPIKVSAPCEGECVTMYQPYSYCTDCGMRLGTGAGLEYGPCPCGPSDEKVNFGGGDVSGDTFSHVCNFKFTCIDLDYHQLRCDICGETFTDKHRWAGDDHTSKCVNCGAERYMIYAISRHQETDEIGDTGAAEGVLNYNYDLADVGHRWYLKENTPTTTGPWHSVARYQDIVGWKSDASGHKPPASQATTLPTYDHFNINSDMSRTSLVPEVSHEGHAYNDSPMVLSYDPSTDQVENDGNGHVTSRLVDNNAQRLTLTYDRETYTVKFNVEFDARGNTVAPINDQTVLHNGVVRVPAGENEPVLENYYFGGWYLGDDATQTTEFREDQKYDFMTPVNRSFTLYAHWIPRTDVTYRTEYWLKNLNGQYELMDYTILGGVKTDETAYAIIRQYPGYIHNPDAAGTVLSVRVTNDSKAVMKVYYDRATFRITFDTNGGMPVALPGETKKYDEVVSQPVVTNTGYVLDHWEAVSIVNGVESSPYKYDFSSPVRTDLKLKAIWVPENAHAYRIEYYTQGLDGQYNLVKSDTKYAAVGEEVTIPMETFEGVSLNTGKSHLSHVIPASGDVTLTAYYDRAQYTVSFEMNGTESPDSVPDQTLYHGALAVKPELVKTGYHIDHWEAKVPGGATYTYDWSVPVTSDLVLKPIWLPDGEIRYTVNNYVQGLDGAYTLHDSHYLYSSVGSTVSANRDTYEGCYFSQSETDAHGGKTTGVIPAEGELVLDVYYARYEYEVIYDVNGGGYADTSFEVTRHILHGNTASKPEVTLPGYELAGWEATTDSGAKTMWDFGTPVTEDMHLKAIWKAEGDHEYTVNFWVQSKSGEYELLETQTKFAKVDASVGIDLRTMEGVYYDAAKTDGGDKGVIPATGKLVLNAYYTRYVYQVKFDANGGESEDLKPVVDVLHGNTVARPTVTKTGYELDHWVAVDETGAEFMFTFGTPITGNITLKPIWKAEGSHVYMTEHWVMGLDGTYYRDITVSNYGSVGDHVHGDVLTYEGCDFATDYEGNVPNGTIPETGELVLKLYYERRQYDVAFDTDGGEPASIDTVRLYHGNLVKRPEVTKTGYEVDHWEAVTEDGSAYTYDFSRPVERNLTLKAIWRPEDARSYQVNYWVQNTAGEYVVFENINGYGTVGQKVDADIKTYEGVAVDKAHEGYSDSGVIPEDGNETLILNVYYTRFVYQVKFDANGGTPADIPGVSVLYGNQVGRPEVAKDGYVVSHWEAITDEGANFVYDYSTPVTQNLTLRAIWVPETEHEYQVNYWVQNQSGEYEVYESQNLLSTVDKTVTADMKQFSGVYVDKDHAGYKDSGVIPAEGKLVLDVYYTRYQYTVSFDANGGVLGTGSSLDPQTILYGNKAVEPKLSMDGYVLTGWKAIDKNGSEFDWSYANQVTEDLTLKAVWAPAEDVSYIVQHWLMNKDGETYELKDRYTGKGKTDDEITAEIKRYEGFHLNDKVDGSKLEGVIRPDGVLMLNVYYDRDVFTVTMDPKNGEPVKTVKVLYDCLVPEWNPEHFAWTFLGWSSGNSMYDMAAPVTNNLSLTAKWSNQDKIVINDVTVYMTEGAKITETDSYYLIEDKATIDVGDNMTIKQERFETTIYDKASNTLVTDAEILIHFDRDFEYDMFGGTISGDRNTVTADGAVNVNGFTMTHVKGSDVHADTGLMDAVAGTVIKHGPSGIVTILKTGMEIDPREGVANVPAGGRLVRDGVDMLFPNGAIVDLTSGRIILDDGQSVIVNPDGGDIDRVEVVPPAGGGEVVIPGGDDMTVTVPEGSTITVGGVTMTPEMPVIIDYDKGTVTVTEDGKVTMKSDDGTDIELDLKAGDVITCEDGHAKIDMDGSQVIKFIIYNPDGSVKETVTVSNSDSTIDIDQPKGTWSTDGSGKTNADASYPDGSDWNLKADDGMSMAANGDITGGEMAIVRTNDDERSPQNITTEGVTILDHEGMTSTGETRVTNPDGQVTVSDTGLHVDQEGNISTDVGTGTVIKREDIVDENGNPAVKITIDDEKGNHTVIITTGDEVIDQISRPEKVTTDTTDGGYTTIEHWNDNDPTGHWFVKTEGSETVTLPDGDSTVTKPEDGKQTSVDNANGSLATDGASHIASDGTITGTDGQPTKAHGETANGVITDVVNRGGEVTVHPDGTVDVTGGTGTTRIDDGEGTVSVDRNDPDGTVIRVENSGGTVDVADDGDIKTAGGNTHIERDTTDEGGKPVHTVVDNKGGHTEVDPEGNIWTDNAKDTNGDGKPDGSTEIVVDKRDEHGNPVHTEVSNEDGTTMTDKNGNTETTGGKTVIETDTKDDAGNPVHSEIANDGGKTETDGSGNTGTDNTNGGTTTVVTDKTDGKGDPVHTEVTNDGGKTETDYNGNTSTTGGKTDIVTDTIGDNDKPVHSEITNDGGNTNTDGDGNTDTDNTNGGTTTVVTDKTDGKGDPVHTEVSNDGGKTETDYNGNTSTTGGKTDIVTDTIGDNDKPVHSEITNDGGNTNTDGDGNTDTDNTNGGTTIIVTDKTDDKGDPWHTEIKNEDGKTETDYNGNTTVTGGKTEVTITDPDGGKTNIENNGGTVITDGEGNVITDGPTHVTDPDGNETDLPNGGQIDAGGDNGSGTIVSPGGDITLDDGSIVKLPEPTTHHPDGSYEADGAILIIRPDGTRIYLPHGGRVWPEGNVETKKDVVMTYPNGTKTTLDSGNTKISPIDTLVSDGDIDVDFADGRHVDMPNGGTVRKEGSVVSDKDITVTYPNGREVLIPDGGKVNKDGNIDLDKDQCVMVGGTKVTLPLAGGTVTVNNNGCLIVPNNGKAVDKNNRNYNLTWGGAVDNPTGKVTVYPNPNPSYPVYVPTYPSNPGGNNGNNNNNNGNNNGTQIGDGDTPLSGPYYGLTDVMPGYWYYEWMANAIYRGYIDAQGKSMIDANGIVSRKEAAFTIKRLMAGQSAYSSSTAIKHYSDVNAATKYSGEIAYNWDKSFMVGTSPTTFSPDDTLTREQFALILYRIFGKYFVNTTHKNMNTMFSDASNISSWSREAVQWAVDNNLMVGSNGKLLPKNGVSRAEMATLVMRVALVLENKGISSGIIAPVTPVTGVPTPPTIDVSALHLEELTVRKR